MYTVKIMNEYLHGPIWVYNQEGIAMYNFPLIDEDQVLKSLNNKAMELFSAYYEFDKAGESCTFNKEKEKQERHTMLDIISKIIARLNEINDGSFEIEDYETSRLSEL